MLNWNAHRIDEAIAEVHLLLKDASSVLAILKHNVAQTRSVLAAWATPQPFDRKEGKVCNVWQSQSLEFQGCFGIGWRGLLCHEWAGAVHGHSQVLQCTATNND